MRGLVVALVGAVVVAGCAAQRVRDAQEALTATIARCKAEYSVEAGHFLDRARCDEAARRNLHRTQGGPADLVDLYLARRADIAARLDKGEITKERANILEAEARRDAVNETQARASVRQAAALQDYMVMERIRQANQPQLDPVPPLRGPVTTNCYRLGNVVNCTSN